MTQKSPASAILPPGARAPGYRPGATYADGYRKGQESMVAAPTQGAGQCLNCPECGALLWHYPDGRETCSRCEYEQADRDPAVCDKCQEVMSAAVGLPVTERRSPAERDQAYSPAEFRKLQDIIDTQADMLIDLRNEVNQAAVQVENAGKPISEAPKDGSVQAFDIGFKARAYWDDELKRWVLVFALRMDYLPQHAKWLGPARSPQHPSSV